jgi:glycosyltransferase involved in cell wall biosynthesis
MIEGHDILCFSNDWNGDPLSKKHIMTRLARRNRVLWINSIGNRNPTVSTRDLKRMTAKLTDFASGIRRAGKNLYTFSPLAIPFHGNAAARWINRRFVSRSIRAAAAHLGFEQPITWTFLPTSADIAGTLSEKLVVYHCVDEFSEFSGTDRQAILQMEQRLIAKSDVVIVSSRRLLDNKRTQKPDTFLVTHGVEIEHFRKACSAETPVPQEIARLPQPVIGFFGLVADWVDLELVAFLARSRPTWSFVLIGKIETAIEPLRGLSNVQLLGRRDYAELPGYCKGMRAAMLPFVINELTLAANPLKAREYLAAGLPVVSTAIPEVEGLSAAVHVARGREDFLAQLDGLIQRGETGPRLAISRSIARESWDAKVEELSRIVARSLSQDLAPAVKNLVQCASPRS